MTTSSCFNQYETFTCIPCKKNHKYLGDLLGNYGYLNVDFESLINILREISSFSTFELNKYSKNHKIIVLDLNYICIS